jgi:hypothetical protein
MHGADVRARLQQLRGEGMPQGTAGYLFLDAGDPGRILYKLVLYPVSPGWTVEPDCLRDGFSSSLTCSVPAGTRRISYALSLVAS